MHSTPHSPPQDHSPEPKSGPALLASLLDVLGVTAPVRRELFERLLATQAHRRLAPEQAERAIEQAFDYHASLAGTALGIVRAIHGGDAAPPGAPADFDESAMSLGLLNLGCWTERLTCSPLRYAARLVLTPQQQDLLRWIVEGRAQATSARDNTVA